MNGGSRYFVVAAIWANKVVIATTRVVVMVVAGCVRMLAFMLERKQLSLDYFSLGIMQT